MPVVVPEPDGRVVQGVLVAQDAEGGRVQQQVARVPGGQADPSGRQHAEEVAVAEQQDAAAGLPQAGDDAVGAVADVGDRLASGAAVAEQVPAGPLLADLGGPPALVRAVVPLGQVGDDLGAGPRSRPARRSGGRARAG